MQHTQQVLQQLLENQLFVKAEKYKFHQQSVSVLGFIVAPSSIQMDPVKVSDGLACSHRQKEAAQIFGLCKFYVSLRIVPLLQPLSTLSHYPELTSRPRRLSSPSSRGSFLHLSSPYRTQSLSSGSMSVIWGWGLTSSNAAPMITRFTPVLFFQEAILCWMEL